MYYFYPFIFSMPFQSLFVVMVLRVKCHHTVVSPNRLHHTVLSPQGPPSRASSLLTSSPLSAGQKTFVAHSDSLGDLKIYIYQEIITLGKNLLVKKQHSLVWRCTNYALTSTGWHWTNCCILKTICIYAILVSTLKHTFENHYFFRLSSLEITW